MKDFPVNEIKNSSSSGFIINYFMPHQATPDDSDKLGEHRDDFYMFFLIEKGEASIMIDFHEQHLQASSIFYVLPGQIHRRFSAEESASGWFVGIDTPLIPSDYRDVFESQLLLQRPLILEPELLQQSLRLLQLIDERSLNDSPFNLQIVHSLLQSFLGIVAGSFKNIHGSNLQLSRPALLSQEFKKLLVQHILTIKSPSEYAAMMHVSASYLNEVLKKTTGFSVSYWIQHQIVLEAKRLLYYTQLNVKEIAHQLGYEDSTYFSRIFKNFTGTTPLAFQAEYRK
jgi:AraC-like DNA-binding protein